MRNNILLVIAVLFGAASPAIAAKTAAMNRKDRNITISNRGVQAIYVLAKAEPGFRLMVEQDTESTLKPDDLKVVRSWTVPAGTIFINSGLTARGTPVRHPTVAREATLVWTYRSRTTGKIGLIKDACMNPVQSRAAVPHTKPAETTWDMKEVDVDVELSLAIHNNQQLTATASATTAPISIVNNITMASPATMVVGGSSPNQFAFVRDSRGLLSLGYTIGGVVKIYNSNTNIAKGGAGGSASVGPITNNNANSNVNANANNTVVNTGSGTASGSAASSGSSTAKAGGG